MILQPKRIPVVRCSALFGDIRSIALWFQRTEKPLERHAVFCKEQASRREIRRHYLKESAKSLRLVVKLLRLSGLMSWRLLRDSAIESILRFADGFVLLSGFLRRRVCKYSCDAAVMTPNVRAHRPPSPDLSKFQNSKASV